MGIAGMGTFRPELIMKSLIPGKFYYNLRYRFYIIYNLIIYDDIKFIKKMWNFLLNCVFLFYNEI